MERESRIRGVFSVRLSSTDGDSVINCWTAGVRGLASGQPPLIRSRYSSTSFCMLLTLATIFFSLTSVQANFNFSGTTYSCSTNLICLGDTHVLNKTITPTIQKGRLSLLTETYAPNRSGIAYYYKQVRMLDLSTNTSTSFSTSFAINAVYQSYEGGNAIQGDGMAFVISADNSTLGMDGPFFGIFNGTTGRTSFKSIVVEFDTFRNKKYPMLDISDHHVSFDFNNITTSIAENNTDIQQWGLHTFYAWVEYCSETQLLELRTSANLEVKPPNPQLSQKVDLFDIAEEYMWVGFSSSSGHYWTNFYVGKWTFESAWTCQTPSTPAQTSRGRNEALIVGLSVVIFAILSTGFVTAFFVWRRLGSRGYLKKTIQIEGMPERFRYKQLSAATKNFSEESKLGHGGFGSVYRGVLPGSGRLVAVKRISRGSSQGEKEFMAEISIISQLRHRNLIQLLGWCKRSSDYKYLLVYELMPNGSLDKALFGSAERQAMLLSWEQRLNIVTGTAAALDYLHQGWTQQVIHRDIKSSNIMLDVEWNAKLGDFGLARLVDHRREGETTAFAGTFGYIAPEMAATGKYTDKSDVYGFGAVLLEVACGRKALLTDLPEGEMFLVDWVWASLSEGNLLRTVDKRLEKYDARWMEVVLTMGLLCSHPDPLARPTMRHVAEVLAGSVPVPSIPAFQPAPVIRSFNSKLSLNISGQSKLHTLSILERELDRYR